MGDDAEERRPEAARRVASLALAAIERRELAAMLVAVAVHTSVKGEPSVARVLRLVRAMAARAGDVHVLAVERIDRALVRREAYRAREPEPLNRRVALHA